MADNTTTEFLVIDTAQTEANLARAQKAIEDMATATAAGQDKSVKAFLATRTATEKLSLATAGLKSGTDDAGKQTDLYRESLAALERKGLRLAEEATKRLAREQETLARKSLKEAADRYEHAANRAQSYGKTLDALHLPGRQIFRDVEDLNEALKYMTQSGTAADVAFLKQIQTIGLFVGAAGLAAVAAVGIGIAAAAVITQTRDWDKELSKVGLQLDSAIIARADTAVASMGAMELATKRLGATLADALAPAIEASATRVTAFSLAATDALKEWREGNYLAASSTLALSYSTNAYVEKAEALAVAQEKLNTHTREYRKELDPLLIAMKAHKEEEKEAEATRKRKAEALKRETEALKEHVIAQGAMRESPTQLKQIATSWDGVAQSIVAATVSATEFEAAAARGAKAGEASARVAKAQAEAVRDAYTAAASSIASSASQAFGMWAAAEAAQVQKSGENIRSLQDQMTAATTDGEKKQLRERIARLKAQQKEDLKHAKMANALQKSAAVISIGINTAGAIVKAWSMFGPPPSPAGIASAIAAGIGGAIEAAAVLAAPDPSYTGGGASMPPVPTGGGSSGPARGVAGAAQGGVPSVEAGAVPMGTPQTAAHVTRADNSSPMQLSDGYVPPSSKSMNVKTSPGDGIFAFKGGTNGQGLPADPRSLALLERNNDLVELHILATRALADAVMYQQHRNTVAPPPGRQ